MLALMGLASLVVDLGIVRASQMSQQLAADVAALEGLRQRDAIPDDPNVGPDEGRRVAASEFAELVFDEDMDLGTENVAYQLGAGPVLSTGVESSELPEGGMLAGGAPFVPVLQTNAATNAVHGDLVAGSYTAVDPLNPGNPSWHVELENYNRFDFAVAAAADSLTAPSFLARVRRTNDTLLDAQDGVSSTGPTIPLLFGLGAALSADEGYDPRRDGFTVRATSIASARPAVAVGVGRAGIPGLSAVGTDGNLPGVDRVLAIVDESWRLDLPIGGLFRIRVGNDGSVSGDPLGSTPTVQGAAVAATGWLRVGELVSAEVAPGSVVLNSLLPEVGGIRAVAIVSALGFGANTRVLGFGSVRIDQTFIELEPGGERTLILAGEKIPSRVAVENASAVPGLAVQIASLLPDSPERQLLLAPVLAR